MNNEVTIDFNNGSFILENKALKLSASVSVPMLQNRKHFTTTEKIIAYLKKSVKGKKKRCCDHRTRSIKSNRNYRFL